MTFKYSTLDTILGKILIIADENSLFYLHFVEQEILGNEIEKLERKYKIQITFGTNKIIEATKQELDDYFAGKLKKFNVSISLIGTEFQKSVWKELAKIPCSKTVSYSEIARRMNKPKSYRAIANANRANPIYVIIPCHRIVSSDGKLGGYGAGVKNKKWLIDHENSTI